MGYVAVKGGAEAIRHAARSVAFERVKGKSRLLHIDQVKEQLYLGVDRIMSEGALYAPDLAALALKQAAGDTLEAAFMLRAYRTTKARIGYSIPCSTSEMRVIRRISAAFKDIPGGQVLGATRDYSIRLLDFELVDDPPWKRKQLMKDILSDAAPGRLPDSFPSIIDLLRREGLLVGPGPEARETREIDDITRQPLTFPAGRPAVLQTMTRGETGGLLALAYSSMRGYGDVHPTIGELRVGYMPLRVVHPHSGKPSLAGEVKVTEAEVIARFTPKDGGAKFTLGYGICFGHNEVKAISMAVLDRAMQAGTSKAPAEDQEFVLSHIDGIESMGFCIHYKLPHYVTFQSDLDRIRRTRVQCLKETGERG